MYYYYQTKVLLPQIQVTLADFGYPLQALWLYCFQTLLNYLVFQYFNIERNRLRLFQKRVVSTKVDIQKRVVSTKVDIQKCVVSTKVDNYVCISTQHMYVRLKDIQKYTHVLRVLCEKLWVKTTYLFIQIIQMQSCLYVIYGLPYVSGVHKTF